MFRTILVFLACILTINTFSQGKPENLGPMINAAFAEIRPTVSADGSKLYFVVEGNPANLNFKNDKKAQDVWFSEKDENGNWKQATPCPSPINELKNNSVFWISADGDSILIRGAYDGKNVGKGFSYCTQTSNGWSSPIKLVMDGYTQLAMDQFSGLSMNIDGNVMLLYFSEEKNNPINDIYISKKLENGNWSRPVKLDNVVNTEDYDEIAPFLAADNKTLYYSSNRPGGSGDYDIWMTRRTDDTWTSWSEPVNLGGKINSAGWDGYFAVEANGKNAYFSSASNAAGKSDLYKVTLEPWQQAIPYVNLNVAVVASKTNDTLNNAVVTIHPLGLEDSTSTFVNNDGTFSKNIEYGKKYVIKSTADKFNTSADTLDFTLNGQSKSLTKNFILKEKLDPALLDSTLKFVDSTLAFQDDEGKLVLPPTITDSSSIEQMERLVKGDTVSINNILFDFAKAELRPEAMRELDKIAEMMKAYPKLTIDISAFTDDIGSEEDNLKLSIARAEKAKEYLMTKSVDSTRIKASGKGEQNPIDSNATEIGRQKNRRVVFTLNKEQ